MKTSFLNYQEVETSSFAKSSEQWLLLPSGQNRKKTI